MILAAPYCRQAGPRTDQEHHHDGAYRSQQRHVPGHPNGGSVGGVADKALQRRREVDGHIEGEEEDGDKLRDGVQPPEADADGAILSM